MYRLVNYGVMLLLVVVSLMVGTTTGVPMSRGYGGYQTATLPCYYTITTYATTGVLHHQGTGVLHHQGTGVLHHQGTGVLHHQGTGVLHHQGTGVLHDSVCCPSLLDRGS
jgi:hypothetical protein